MKKKKGFTIIELLTVITIIALIMSIMVPGVKKAKTVAMDLKQKSQLRDIGIGLEFWSYDNDSVYPDSEALTGLTSGLITTGAHRLAEALVGRDGQGFDDNSTWNAEDDNGGTAYLWTGVPAIDREDRYLESEDIGMFQLAQIYGNDGITSNTGNAYPGDYDADGTTSGSFDRAGVLTDVYKNRRVTMPPILLSTGKSVKVGSPILYFKAKDTDIFNDGNPAISVFNYEDNEEIFVLGHNIDVGVSHPYDTIGDFYDTDSSLVNDSIRPILDPIPYNKDTFILMSAGSDGLYGTKDDVMNISK